MVCFTGLFKYLYLRNKLQKIPGMGLARMCRVGVQSAVPRSHSLMRYIKINEKERKKSKISRSWGEAKEKKMACAVVLQYTNLKKQRALLRFLIL